MQREKSALELIHNLSELQRFPDLLEPITLCKHGLIVAGCEAFQGSVENTIPVIAAIACLHRSIIVLDDMLDEDPRGEYHQLGAGVAANQAAILQAAALQIVANTDWEADIKLAVGKALNEMTLHTALGQHLDVHNPATEAEYWELARGKSSPFFIASVYVGALLGGAPLEVAAELKKFGELYGEIVQINDDLADAMQTPPSPDWVHGRNPLPILYAQLVPHPDRERFLALRDQVTAGDAQALEEAQTILIHCGAVSYCVEQLLHRYQLARDHLASLYLPNPDRLERMLTRMVTRMLDGFKKQAFEQPERLLANRKNYFESFPV
ncbi:MAG: polyprenyl synthetase family protein [Anaerolineales bacterium]|nr:polyprenyl synthetase family protein [Anaerolineales bacterium]